MKNQDTAFHIASLLCTVVISAQIQNIENNQISHLSNGPDNTEFRSVCVFH